MDLRADDTLQARPGDFAARVDGGTLLVPRALAQLAQAQRLASAEALAGFVDAFPSAVAASLGWQIGAVTAAARRMSEQLGAPAQPARPTRRVYGLG